MALISVALGYFAVQLAMTSVPPILPTLTRLFEADVSMVSWVITAYFLTVTSSMFRRAVSWASSSAPRLCG